MEKTIEYKEAEQLVKDELLNLDISVVKFCELHSLNYGYVLKVRNQKNTTAYPLLVKKLLAIFFNLDSYQVIHQYSISDKKD
jgi:hypothetical protein